MTIQQVKKSLKEFDSMRMRAEFIKKTNTDYIKSEEYINYDNICNAIEVLPEKLKILVEKIYIEKWSIRACEKEYHYCRNTIYKLINQAIELISGCI